MDNKQDILEVINALLMVIDIKDHYTMSHSLLVMDYAQSIAEKLKLPKKEQQTIRFAGFLHDTGKIAIPDAILQKPGPLSSEEYETIKTHPQEGAKIIGQITSLKDILPLVLYHHERMDGSGYPEGRKNDEIPLGSKILAVADTYSALISNRPYKSALSATESANILNSLGNILDPFLIKIFLEEVANGKV
ncbi:MAG: HD domain-containing phosphohydrolase [Candidatus Ratteibacteria bacterium]|jgi:HD-GYP domain-containing protein (c-di-GMP phosphodiesterase class II)